MSTVTYQNEKIDINEENALSNMLWTALENLVIDNLVQLTEEQTDTMKENTPYSDSYYNAWCENYEELKSINLDDYLEIAYETILEDGINTVFQVYA